MSPKSFWTQFSCSEWYIYRDFCDMERSLAEQTSLDLYWSRSRFIYISAGTQLTWICLCVFLGGGWLSLQEISGIRPRPHPHPYPFKLICSCTFRWRYCLDTYSAACQPTREAENSGLSCSNLSFRYSMRLSTLCPFCPLDRKLIWPENRPECGRNINILMPLQACQVRFLWLRN
jgi:hypothetical protein